MTKFHKDILKLNSSDDKSLFKSFIIKVLSKYQILRLKNTFGSWRWFWCFSEPHRTLKFTLLKQPTEVFCKKRCSVLLKKRLWHRCFPANHEKFLRTHFLQNTSGRLLLLIPGIHKNMLHELKGALKFIVICKTQHFHSSSSLNYLNIPGGNIDVFYSHKDHMVDCENKKNLKNFGSSWHSGAKHALLQSSKYAVFDHTLRFRLHLLG